MLRKSIDKETQDKTLWFMFLRALVTTLLLAITLIYQIKDTTVILPQDLLPVYALIGLTYMVTILCAMVINKVKNLTTFVMSQIAYDILFITALIFITGTQQAVFTFLYLFTIAFAAALFMKTGALYTAAFASICFSALLILDPIPNSEKHLLTLFFNNVAFFLVALLAGYLSEQFRQYRLKLTEEQQSVRELEDINKTIINNMTSGLLTTDLKHQIIYFNRAAEKITGLSLSNIYKKNIFEVFPGLKQHWLQRASSQPQDLASRRSFKFKKSPQEELTMGFSLSPLHDANHVRAGHILIFEDLTKFLEMEQHLRRSDRLAAVGKLAAGIAHEIRNPLASVSGSIQVLSHDLKVKDENKKLMDIILKETDRLNILVNEFLDYVRPSELKMEIFDLNPCIADTLLAISMNKDIRKNIQTIFKPEIKPLLVRGNKEKLKQVFWNLLINAHQAMKHKSDGTLKIHTTVKENQAFIEISDTGEGMSEEVVHKIFDPFFTTKEKGTGLGLSVVHKIIESHKGRIVVNAAVGKGSTFTIALPLK